MRIQEIEKKKETSFDIRYFLIFFRIYNIVFPTYEKAMGIWDDFKSFGSSVEKWGASVADNVEGSVKWGVGQGTNIIEHTEDTFSSIISTPLLLIAGGIALFLWNSDAGQVAQVTKNVAPVFV